MEEEFDISSSSSTEIHPNIDARSFKEWKRQKRAEEKNRRKKRLDDLRILAKGRTLTKDEQHEKEWLVEKLAPKVIAKNMGSFRISEMQQMNDDESYESEMLEMLGDSSLRNFLDVVERRWKVDWTSFENYINGNLIYNIKVDNDVGGIALCRLSIYLSYMLEQGKDALIKLNKKLQDPEFDEKFEKDLELYYANARDAILKMNKSDQEEAQLVKE